MVEADTVSKLCAGFKGNVVLLADRLDIKLVAIAGCPSAKGYSNGILSVDLPLGLGRFSGVG